MMNPQHNPLLNAQFNRRALLGGALGVAAAGMLVACGAPSTGASSAGTPVAGGRFRVGFLGGSGADAIDPILSSSGVDGMRMRQLYDTLTRVNEQGVFVPHLAEEIVEVDPMTWTFRLRQGVTFHNGKALTADDVIFSLQRVFQPGSRAASNVPMIDPNGITKVDDLTVQMALAAPAYYLRESLAQAATSIVPVGFDPANPVGTGPFSLTSFTPGQQVLFAKNPDYWNGAPLVDEIAVTTFADESARVNALQGGQIDHAPLLAAPYASVVEAANGLTLNQYASGRFENFILNCQSDEFRDPEARKAMRLILNRQQIVDQVYGGRARVGNDVAETTSVYYDKAMEQWEPNVEEAKSILKSAGKSDMQLELTTSALTPTMVNLAEVYVQQLTEAGVDARISQLDGGSWYSDGFGDRTFSQEIWGGWTFATWVDISELPGAVYNAAHWDNEEFASSFRAASLTTDEAQRQQHLNDAQQLMHDQSGTLIPAFVDVLDGYSSKISGYKTDVLGLGGGDFDYTDISISR